ncbi:uncharacterized protein B0I36DRAFT_324865 [Microdochium trichocladiopsis]|uniref:Uncharacterized protein n=1 Tax=Microdochium trichocladiopsis TaxID=1682393 RepID=A0A9P9BP96_9PEZI|nr:uncharacterized protein B0I36DRAFT_324865 [Microdochium trichocladiopsis]KAH7029022.1 hypothetical protein B0I36DRAFT_324865 [Microdochium trichocladiopsis]
MASAGNPQDDAAEAEADRISAAHQKALERAKEDEIYRALTSIDGFDATASCRPRPAELLGMAKFLLHKDAGLSQGQDKFMKAVFEVFYAANTVLRSHRAHNTRTDQSQSGKESTAASKPHEQAWFWVLVRRELKSSHGHEDIKHEHLRLVVSFYSAGFHGVFMSDSLQLSGCGSRSLLFFALAEWHMLVDNYRCTLRLTRNSHDSGNKRPREQEDHGYMEPRHENTLPEDVTALLRSMNLPPQRKMARKWTYAEKLHTMTHHLKDLWNSLQSQSRISQGSFIYMFEGLLDLENVVIKSTVLKRSLIAYASGVSSSNQMKTLQAATVAATISTRILLDEDERGVKPTTKAMGEHR